MTCFELNQGGTVRISLALLIAVAFVIPMSALTGCIPRRASISDEFFSVNGVKIHYTIQGRGEPVVLIHGLYSSAWVNWELTGIAGALAKSNRVIALDVPGHGQSDKPDDPSAYGVQLADDVAALLDHLNIKRAHILGYSMGGMITMKFLARHPDRVLSAVVGGMGWLPEGSLLQDVFLGMGNGGTVLGTPPVCPASLAKLALTEDELKKIKLPVELVVGGGDPVKALYVDPLERIRSDWPVVIVDDAGHIDCVVKPQFKDAIVRWIAAHQ